MLYFGQHRIQAVLWDLDGTLIDTAPDFIRIIKQLCAAQNIAAPSDLAIRDQVSEGARAMVRLIYPNLALDDSNLLAARDGFLQAYAEHIAVDSCLFAGLEAFLQQLELNHIPWGIVTNKPRHLATALLTALNLDRRCAVLVCPDDVSQPKPHPEPMLLAASKLGIAAAHIVYIGDHPRDIDAGIAAGMPTLLAAYGYIALAHRHNLNSWGANTIAHTSLAVASCFTWS